MDSSTSETEGGAGGGQMQKVNKKNVSPTTFNKWEFSSQFTIVSMFGPEVIG